MKPEIATFTKKRPVTKADIWGVFRGQRGFRQVQVDRAKAVIGANAPRYWERMGYMVSKTNRKDELVYELTEAGKRHLLEGMERYLRNHPAEKGDIPHLPKGMQ